MMEIKNLNDKRICDESTDKRTIEIRKKDCITLITANPDCTLNVVHGHIDPAT